MLVLNSLTPRAPGHIRSHQSTRKLQDHHESLHLTTTADLHREKRWEKNGNRRQEEQTRAAGSGGAAERRAQAGEAGGSDRAETPGPAASSLLLRHLMGA